MDIISFLEISTFTGLPAHPFLNRIAMYVVPTSLALSALVVIRPSLRRRLAPWLFALAAAALVSVQLTMGAGEVMDNVIHRDANPLVEEHEDWSKLLRFGLIGQVIVAGLFAWGERRRWAGSDDQSAGSSSGARFPAVAGLAAVALAVGANAYLTVMTAHTGSKSVYQDDGRVLLAETADSSQP